ncbi:ParB/RepB/Spo0J family partition protein [Desulfococcaceae bacterium HSG7]|nr:ParB/RepB/Spo0J family partition protein [Desulfococcaceae bacterium HSG7]
MHTYPIKSVPLEQIDLNDKTFLITTSERINALSESIQELGVMNPPLLIKKKGLTPGCLFSVVYGFQRIAACIKLGWDSIDSVLADTAMPGLTCVKLAIADNIWQRSLNLVETSRALNLLAPYFQDETSLAEAASTSGLPDNIGLIRKIKSICHLSPLIQDGLLAGPLTLPTAIELGNLDKEAGCRLAEIFTALQLSLSKQREILTLTHEIVCREGISLAELVNGNAFKQILNNDNLDRSQKTGSLRSYLKQRRFPAITSAETAFKANWRKIKSGTGLELIPPPHFEGDVFTLRIQFKTVEELLAHNRAIAQISKHPVMKKILDKIPASSK